jgi:hypothetical protein
LLPVSFVRVTVIKGILNIFKNAVAWWQGKQKSIQRITLDFQLGSIQDRLSFVRFGQYDRGGTPAFA